MPRQRDGLHCWVHDPDRRAERQEARRRGGRATRSGPRGAPPENWSLRNPEDVLTLLEVAARDALRLRNSAARTRALVAVARAAVLALEHREVEDRLALVEAMVQGYEQRR